MKIHSPRWKSHFTLAVFAVAATAWSQSPPPAPDRLVRQIDHIMIDSNDPEKLFHLLLDKFQLPLGWPYRSYGTFSSGGVGMGNVIIEAIHQDDAHPGIEGVALEPSSIPEVIAGLDAQGLKHEAPQPVYQKDSSGNQRLAWTTLYLNLSVDGFFICKYNSSVEPRRKRIHDELQSRNGGPLGVESITEVVVGVRDMAAAQHEFRSLLGPPQAGQESLWTVGDGPAIRLMPDKQNHLALLRVKVKSLPQARAFLKAENLLGDDTGQKILLAASAAGETGIEFEE